MSRWHIPVPTGRRLTKFDLAILVVGNLALVLTFCVGVYLSLRVSPITGIVVAVCSVFMFVLGLMMYRHNRVLN